MIIANLTQHTASAEQVAAGVRDLQGEARERLVSLLSFDALPSKEEIARRARAIAALVECDECRAVAGYCAGNGMGPHTAPDAAMIGGAPYLMSALESALMKVGVSPLYAFSERCSEEQVLPSGSTRKVAVFRHMGFVPA